MDLDSDGGGDDELKLKCNARIIFPLEFQKWFSF